MKRRREPHPMTRLAIAMRSAARNIESGNFRKIAADDAARIPKCRAEIGGGRRGEMARAGRALLAALPATEPSEFSDAAIRLNAYADAVLSNFEVVSESCMADRRSRTTRESRSNFAAR